MTQGLTSAYGGDNMIMSDALKDPTFIPQRVLTELDGTFLEEALFRNGGSNDGVVAYREAASPFLDDDAEEVAEFAEIPISNLNLGKAHTLVGVKTGLGVRVSLEQQRELVDSWMAQQERALLSTIRRNGVEAALAAFRAAQTPTLTVTAAWEDDAADPMRDIRLAKRMVGTAKDPVRETALMGYRPDAIVLNEGTLDVALWHDKVQKFYRGNAAADNPLYRGITPDALGGLRVVVSEFIPEGEAYVMETGTAGFISDTIPLTVTPMYSESGENGFGGSRQAWRTDAFRKRIIAVDNPRAVVKIVGIEA